VEQWAQAESEEITGGLLISDRAGLVGGKGSL
jgi:hypothetical protein